MAKGDQADKAAIDADNPSALSPPTGQNPV